ncbi:MAG: hypothetical protein WDW38_004159 [Sanguina aurantia]
MQWLSSLVDEFPQASPQQRSGNLSSAQLFAFFSQSSRIFNDLGFKQRLAVEHRQKRDIQETINEMQRQVFESQGVQGAYGIQFLAKVKKVHGQDAPLLTAFYEFVQREEMALDEAELPGSEFQNKYEQLAKLKAVLEAEAVDLPGMTLGQRQQHMAGVMQKLVASTAQGPTCTTPSSAAGGGHQHGPSCGYIPLRRSPSALRCRTTSS